MIALGRESPCAAPPSVQPGARSPTQAADCTSNKYWPTSPRTAAARVRGRSVALPGDLRDEVSGQHLVVIRHHPEHAPATRHRTEVEGVPGQLGLGHDGLDLVPEAELAQY